jgi:hypothetical protein
MKSVVSLFSGIGGLCHHGISAAGLSHKFRVQQFVEISPYSQSQLRHEQPGIPIHADITNYRCHQGQFDILCGGFPCSGTSNAGDKKGLNDPRSGLWREMFRIINQCRPAIALTGIREVAFGVPIGVAKGIKGNYDARRAYGLSCSPRQAAIAWKRIDYLCSLLAHNEA